MAEVLLFHHAQGLTQGVLSFADRFRAAGHEVHAPDLYAGRTFDDLTEGVRHAEEEVGLDAILERARRAAEPLPDRLVYAGLSLGAVAAQMLTQTRPGARGAFLMHGCVMTSEFDRPWPESAPLQIHTMDADEWGELDSAHELAETIGGAELFLYPGDRHLFTDNSLPDYDEEATGLVTDRALGLLDGIN